MLNTEITKKLLTENPRVLKGLHDAFGFDFEQPHTIAMVCGKTTSSQLRKALASQGFIEGAGPAVVLMRDQKPDYDGRRQGFRAFTLDGKGYERGDFSGKIYPSCGVDWLTRKKEFESLRKRQTALTFVVAQRMKFLTHPKPREAAPWERYTLSLRYGGWNSNGILLKDRDGNEVKYTRYIREAEKDLLDKSGYLVAARREGLREQAAKLRKEREKAEFMGTDNREKVEHIERLIEQRKAELASRLLAAKTYREIERIGDSLDIWKGLAGTVRKFNDFREKVEEKSFPSIASMNSAYESLVTALTPEEQAATA